MYQSTRGNMNNQSAMQAIVQGMVPSGGLYVPTEIPQIEWRDYQGLTYREVAEKIMKLYLPEFSDEFIRRVTKVYDYPVFDGENPARTVAVGDVGVLELWHGPTAAFKDMALQMLPFLLKESIDTLYPGTEVLILTATSGDTGKAALEGFKDVEGMHIVVFYPEGGVSAVQERQMITTEGKNTAVVAVKGNFDQCQTAVKEVFASFAQMDPAELNHKMISSANSINWGRLLPQIVYYVWTYLSVVEQGKIEAGSPLNIVVPTGNFGNILAAYYAKQMGIPLGNLICASNKNNVLSDFFQTGVYESNRPFYLTMAPSMDILISSNFERFIYEMSGRDAAKVVGWFKDLAQSGSFKVDPQTLQRCREQMVAGWADEKQILAIIAKYFQEHHYVLDPHTAVAAKVYEDYVNKTGDPTYSVIVSTASPFKFAGSVLAGIGNHEQVTDWQALEVLAEKTGWEIPNNLRNLLERPEKEVFKCNPEQISELLRQRFLDS